MFRPTITVTIIVKDEINAVHAEIERHIQVHRDEEFEEELNRVVESAHHTARKLKEFAS